MISSFECALKGREIKGLQNVYSFKILTDYVESLKKQ